MYTSSLPRDCMLHDVEEVTQNENTTIGTEWYYFTISHVHVHTHVHYQLLINYNLWRKLAAASGVTMSLL
jgi:hypothetical protein